MVASARRAAANEAEAQVVELGTVASARRAVGGTRPFARYAIAPLAIAAVVGLGVGLMGVTPAVDQTDPVAASTADLGTSRDLARPELFLSPSALPTASPSAVASATPSAAVTPAAATPSASATPTAAGTPAVVTPTPVDYDALGKVAGTWFAKDDVNVRTGPGTGFETVTTLAEDEPIAITQRAVDGWRQVVVSDESGWVKASFLTDDKPVVQETASSSSGGASSSPGGFSTAACTKAGDLESNLTSRTAKVLRAVCGEFDGVSSYGGYRPGSGSYHGSGQAIDIMVSGDYGQQIADWARANASELGIIEVIYEQKIWTTQRAGEGWRGMSDRGSVSANHYDHVHVSVG